MSFWFWGYIEKTANIRKRYNQVSYLPEHQMGKWQKVNAMHKKAKRLALSKQVITGMQGTDKTVEQRFTKARLYWDVSLVALKKVDIPNNVAAHQCLHSVCFRNKGTIYMPADILPSTVWNKRLMQELRNCKKLLFRSFYIFRQYYRQQSDMFLDFSRGCRKYLVKRIRGLSQ